MSGVDAEWLAEEEHIDSERETRSNNNPGRKMDGLETNIKRMEKLETVMVCWLSLLSSCDLAKFRCSQFYVHGGETLTRFLSLVLNVVQVDTPGVPSVGFFHLFL